MDPQFVDLFWNSPLGAREIASLAVTSAGLYSLSTKKIGAVPVPVPPLDEQREIVQRVGHFMTTAEALLERIASAARGIDRSTQAVLAKAFRGDLMPAEK
jgi:type I restriction enzyme S subunit